MPLNEKALINDTNFTFTYSVNEEYNTLEFHSHDDYEILYFKTGEIQYYVEDKSYYMMPGDVLIIAPGIMHRLVVIKEKAEYERVVLMLSTPYGKKLLQELPESFLLHPGKCYHISLSEKENADFQYITEKIRRLPHTYAGLLQRDAFVTLILLQLQRMIEQTPVQPKVADKSMQQIIAHINRNFTRNISLQEIADQFYMSKYHLLRQFKNYTHSTVHQYILSKRMALAKSLLKEGLSPTEVSRTCGFGTYAGFYQKFVQEVGVSPSEYAHFNK